MTLGNNLNDLQKKLVDDALKIAEVFNIKLDFSHDSVKQMDSILDAVGKDYMSTKNTDGLDGIALQFAAYIVAVIERQSEKGEWRRDDPEFGRNTFPYAWRGKILFPFIWCKKRIEIGEQENIWSKYQSLVLENIRSRSV